jgi:hypothetical protein
MAAVSLKTAAFRERVEKGFEDEAIQNDPLLAILKAEGCVEMSQPVGGDTFTVHPEWADEDLEPDTYGRYTDFTPRESVEMYQAVTEGGHYQDSEIISGVDVDDLEAADDIDRFIPIFETAQNLVEERFERILTSELMYGDQAAGASGDGQRILGITEAIPDDALPGAFSLHGIPFSGNTWWSPTEFGPADGDNGNYDEDFYQLILKANRAASVESSDKSKRRSPTYLLASPAEVDRIKVLMHRRTGNYPLSEKDAVIGFDTVKIQGTKLKVVESGNMPDNRLLVFHPKAFKLHFKFKRMVRVNVIRDTRKVGHPYMIQLDTGMDLQYRRPRMVSWVRTA